MFGVAADVILAYRGGMSVTSPSVLFDLADAHGGLFTTAEAKAAGLSDRVLSYYYRRGDLDRVSHGIYRFVNYPFHRHQDLIAAALWTPAGSAISHETALGVYGLADAMANLIHVTVPSAFRGKRAGVMVHHAELDATERTVWDDVPVTTIERTLIDVATTSSPDLARTACRQALDAGMTTRPRLGDAIEAAGGDPTAVRAVLSVGRRRAPGVA